MTMNEFVILKSCDYKLCEMKCIVCVKVCNQDKKKNKNITISNHFCAEGQDEFDIYTRIHVTY